MRSILICDGPHAGFGMIVPEGVRAVTLHRELAQMVQVHIPQVSLTDDDGEVYDVHDNGFAWHRRLTAV